jgi:anion-transporting  ArsA/GET3 family ATPase
MAPGFVERADAVTKILGDKRTTFLVVSTLEAAPLHEAEFFIDVLGDKAYSLGAVVLNKVLPGYLLDDAAARVAERLCQDAPALASVLDAAAGEQGQVARVLMEIGENFRNYQVVAQREAEQRAELAAAPDVVATVPYFDTDIYDLTGLLRLAESIWS